MNSAGMFSYIDSINCNFNLNQVPTLLYKVYNVSNDPNNPINTGWLNGNGSLSSDTPLNVNIAGDGSNGLLPSSANFPIVNIRRYWNIIPIPPNTSYDVYIKIGLQSACNLYFDYMYLQSKYLDLATFNTPSNGVFQVISPPRDVKISWSNIETDGYVIQSTRITGNYTNDSIYPRRFVGVGQSKYIDNPINITVSGGITQCNITLSNADTKYTINLSNIATNGTISSNHIIDGKTDLPVYPLSNFYNGSMKFKFFKADNTEGVYFTNCNAFLIDGVNRIRASNIINRQELSINLVTTVGDNNDPFIINSSNSTLPEYYPGRGLSNFILYANINGSIVSNQFSNEQYSNNITTFDRSNNNIKLQFSNAGDISTDVRDTGFFYKSALRVITLATLQDGSNTITLSNNYLCNYSQSFFANSPLTPAVNKVFVDTNGLANTNYYTYVSGVLVFRTITACNYNFWMQTSNLNSKFIMDTPITFALQSNSVNISNLSVKGSNVIVYSAANTGSVLTNSFVNANNNTFFSWPNVSLSNLTNIGPENPLNLVGTASNLSGGSAELSHSLRTESGFQLYFDNESIQTIQLTSSSNFASNSPNVLCNWGYKVTSGTGLYPGVTATFTQYNHNSNLLIGTYSNELQLANGYFTSSNSFAYLDYGQNYNPISGSYTYPNYTSIAITSSVRWATFVWYIAGTNKIGNYATITFNNHNLRSTSVDTVSGQPLYRFFKFDDIFFYYKIIGLRAGQPPILRRSSGWLDGNKFLATNYNLPDTSYTASNVNGNAGGLAGLIGSINLTPNSNIKYIIVSDTGSGTSGTTGILGIAPYLLYIRIGIPINVNQYFRNIRLANITT
jgi:hypothetical protein